MCKLINGEGEADASSAVDFVSHFFMPAGGVILDPIALIPPWPSQTWWCSYVNLHKVIRYYSHAYPTLVYMYPPTVNIQLCSHTELKAVYIYIYI